jgi:L-amino acid N-acyltransferase YncA
MWEGYSLRPITEEDRKAVVDIFNYYVENSFAAYPESKLPYGFFDMLMQSYRGYPNAVLIYGGEVVGFGGLKAFNPMPVFGRTAEISYFILPKHTGRGVGRRMLAYFEEKAREAGIKSLLAGISSKNGVSLKFHEKNGFTQCGRFKNAGFKRGEYFDVVYMQKTL